MDQNDIEYRISVLWNKRVAPVIKRLPREDRLEITKWGKNFVNFKAAGTEWELKLTHLETTNDSQKQK